MAAGAPSLRGPLLSITHGGGPLPLLGQQKDLVDVLQNYADTVLAPARPDVFIVISAHYHSDKAKVLGVEKPRMIYDYSGFPAEAYKLQYPAPGHPEIAARLFENFKKHPLLADGATLDQQWGFDHGVFVPMTIMAKHASIPIVPVSVSASDNAAHQLAMGEAIRAALINDGINAAVIASGSFFHNFQIIFGRERAPADGSADAFVNAFVELLTSKDISAAERKERLLSWEKLPGARSYHPRGQADHMMPLLALAAVAGYSPATEAKVMPTLGKMKTVDFIWK